MFKRIGRMPFVWSVTTTTHLNMNPATMTQREAEAVKRHGKETGDKAAIRAWNEYCDIVGKRIDARKARPLSIGDTYFRLWGG